MIVHGVAWFSGKHGLIGIVYGETEIDNKRKAYIGVGGGLNEEADVAHIKDWGSPIHANQLQEIVSFLNEK